MTTETQPSPRPACPVCAGALPAIRRSLRVYCSDRCRQNRFARAYRARTGTSYKDRPRLAAAPRPRRSRKCVPGRRVPIERPVRRTSYGYFEAVLRVKGRAFRQRRFSIARMGETGARLAATLWRMSEMIAANVWSPSDGDPFKFLSFADTFSGNAEYAGCVLDTSEMSSPYLVQREEQD